MSKYELLEKHEHLFFDAVTRLRRGSEFMDIVHALDGACTAAGFSSMTLAAEARVYLEELQREAFNAAVEAFESGESIFEVERKLIACSFCPWDAEMIAGRAKQKAEEHS